MNSTHTLYQQRSFSDKFSVCTDWLAINWKQFFKYFTIMLLPFFLVQSLLLSFVMQANSATMTTSMAMPSAATLTYTLLSFLVSLVSSFVCNSLFYAVVKHTFINKQSFQSLGIKSAWQLMKKDMGRLLLSYIVSFIVLMLIIGVVVLLGFASLKTLFVTIPLFLVVSIAILPYQALCVLTDEPMLEALSHAFRLGFKCWWGFFSTTLVMWIFMVVIQILSCIPLYASQALSIVVSVAGGGGLSMVFSVAAFLSYFILVYVSSATSLFFVLIVCVQYGHAVMKVDKEEPINLEEIPT